MDLYNIDALKYRPEIYEEMKLICSPIDFQFMLNFVHKYKEEDKIDKPITILVALLNDYVKRGGHPIDWYKPTGENFAIVRQFQLKPTGRFYWNMILAFLERGIRDSRDYNPVKKKVKDIAIEVSRKMVSGVYPDPFRDDSLNQTHILRDIVNKDYPSIKNLESFRVTVHNIYWSL